MYQRIMDDVIENCQTTFEEDGVNPQILDDLRKVGHLFLSPARTNPWDSFATFIITSTWTSSSCQASHRVRVSVVLS